MIKHTNPPKASWNSVPPRRFKIANTCCALRAYLAIVAALTGTRCTAQCRIWRILCKSEQKASRSYSVMPQDWKCFLWWKQKNSVTFSESRLSSAASGQDQWHWSAKAGATERQTWYKKNSSCFCHRQRRRCLSRKLYVVKCHWCHA